VTAHNRSLRSLSRDSLVSASTAQPTAQKVLVFTTKFRQAREELQIAPMGRSSHSQSIQNCCCVLCQYGSIEFCDPRPGSSSLVGYRQHIPVLAPPSSSIMTDLNLACNFGVGSTAPLHYHCRMHRYDEAYCTPDMQEVPTGTQSIRRSWRCLFVDIPVSSI